MARLSCKMVEEVMMTFSAVSHPTREHRALFQVRALKQVFMAAGMLALGVQPLFAQADTQEKLEKVEDQRKSADRHSACIAGICLGASLDQVLVDWPQPPPQKQQALKVWRLYPNVALTQQRMREFPGIDKSAAETLSRECII